MPADDTRSERRRDFVRDMVEADLASGKYGGRVVTRFPPEPNGYLHIGHAKSICLNFGIATEYGGRCNLRFDDTNPTTEDPEYVEAIQEDIRWLGYDWGDGLFFASDYFERLYDYAVQLIESGKAYVDSSSEEEIRRDRGTVTEPGRESPYRERGVEENLDLFRRMRAGEFADGVHVLRAKIEMSAANMKMRDPLLYRIRHVRHYRRGDDWCIYPMYDFAHCLSDAIESVTHSLCTLEFENNREVYDWVLANTSVDRPPPEQTEFARLALTYTVLSKRKLLELVEGGWVEGWDDPRMPTLSGMRRRGYTPASIRSFCDAIGVAKANSVVDVAQLEHAVRDDLNRSAPRYLAVLDPLKVVITNYPEGESEELDAPLFPADIGREGSRPLPFSRELVIERADFSEHPPRGWRRMAPGREIRLRYAYIVCCVEAIKDPESGEVVEVHCTYDPETRGGGAPDGRQIDGTIHWVSSPHAALVEARLYDRLFKDQRPEPSKASGADFKDSLNASSLEIVAGASAEPEVAKLEPGSRVQFERLGYFYRDPAAGGDRPAFNRTVGLRDSWTKRRPSEQAADGAAGEARSAGAEAAATGASGPTAEKREAEVGLQDGGDSGSPAPLSDAEHRIVDGIVGEHRLRPDDAERLARDPAALELFRAVLARHPRPHTVASWILNEVRGELARSEAGAPVIEPGALAELLAMVDDGRISGRIAKEVLSQSVETGTSPASLVERRGLEQITDREALAQTVEEVLAAHATQVEEYRAGKTALQGFFVGQVMKATSGRAKPDLVQEILAERLDTGAED